PCPARAPGRPAVTPTATPTPSRPTEPTAVTPTDGRSGPWTPAHPEGAAAAAEGAVVLAGDGETCLLEEPPTGLVVRGDVEAHLEHPALGPRVPDDPREETAADALAPRRRYHP